MPPEARNLLRSSSVLTYCGENKMARKLPENGATALSEKEKAPLRSGGLGFRGDGRDERERRERSARAFRFLTGIRQEFARQFAAQQEDPQVC